MEIQCNICVFQTINIQNYSVQIANPRIFCLLADNVAPLKSIWIVGDKFLEATYDTFTEMRTDVDKKNRPMPYMFDFYQVTAFHDKACH